MNPDFEAVKATQRVMSLAETRAMVLKLGPFGESLPARDADELADHVRRGLMSIDEAREELNLRPWDVEHTRERRVWDAVPPQDVRSSVTSPNGVPWEARRLPEPGEDPMSRELPDGPVPLRVNFDPRRTIGSAVLERQADGSITCTAQVIDGEGLLPSLPKFAVGLAAPYSAQPRLYAVSVTEENSNPQVPAYKIAEDDE